MAFFRALDGEVAGLGNCLIYFMRFYSFNFKPNAIQMTHDCVHKKPDSISFGQYKESFEINPHFGLIASLLDSIKKIPIL